jgi:uncharacterized protein
MRTVFADTFYFIAQFSPEDQAHARAMKFTQSFQGRMLTTDWVMVDLADAFAQLPNRARFVTIYEQLQTTDELTIVPAERPLLQEGFKLYADRRDKEWSLTDCLSFVVAARTGITEALTGDHHFEQAGYVALLKRLSTFAIADGPSGSEAPMAAYLPSLNSRMRSVYGPVPACSKEVATMR